MTWIAIGCIALALLLLKLGALLVWVAILTLALKGLLLFAAIGAIAFTVLHAWKRRRT
jgi:uncharacterized membrane protein YesL